ncbi:hypothetical protein [Bacillus salipaludis]|uniref:Uncharacterized protein n=1 Tax=Bacillus salipaludis TaxID=2547811 RepID=A0ABW8RNY8_9BACI
MGTVLLAFLDKDRRLKKDKRTDPVAACMFWSLKAILQVSVQLFGLH